MKFEWFLFHNLHNKGSFILKSPCVTNQRFIGIALINKLACVSCNMEILIYNSHGSDVIQVMSTICITVHTVAWSRDISRMSPTFYSSFHTNTFLSYKSYKSLITKELTQTYKWLSRSTLLLESSSTYIPKINKIPSWMCNYSTSVLVVKWFSNKS